MTRSHVASRLTGLFVSRGSVFSGLGQSTSTSATQPLLGLVSTRNASTLNHKDGKVLHPDLLNADVLKTQYAVRGELYLRAEELRKQGRDIIFTNGKRSWCR